MTDKAYIITGPTSGYGRATALQLAKHGTVVLVGRDPQKLDEMKQLIEKQGGRAVPVVCDLADLMSVRRAAADIIALRLPVVGLLNNAGIMDLKARKNAQGWDLAFATNHLGPFALTEALLPHLPDGGNVLFVASATEDPERKQAKMAGFCGGRYVSAEACARGEWKAGGSKNPGYDAYATSKQCNIATAFELARQTPRLRINAIEPGFSTETGLSRDAGAILNFVAKQMGPLIVRFVKGASTPKVAGPVIAKALLNETGRTGTYYDEKGAPMEGSAFVRDPQFTARVVAETRALLA